MKYKFLFLSLTGFALAVYFNACQSEDELTYARYYSNGAHLYNIHCKSCHGEKGEGLNALIPPLTDTVFIEENKTRLSCIIKFGASGKITVNRRTFDAEMPAENLPDIELAEVITYVTNTFGNHHGLYTTEQVSADLKRCK